MELAEREWNQEEAMPLIVVGKRQHICVCLMPRAIIASMKRRMWTFEYVRPFVVWGNLRAIEE